LELGAFPPRLSFVSISPIVTDNPPSDPSQPTPHRRRPRYSGKYPRRFEEKYKELNPERYANAIAKVLACGKTPAGTHRPIMVQEILHVLAPKPGEIAVDCTLGYGGHAQEILSRIKSGGRLLGLDADSIELPKTEARLRALGFGPDIFTTHRVNFAGLPKILASANLSGVDIILADLGVSSMQLDDPSRGFSAKFDGPLDMRMNPRRGQPASELLARLTPDHFAKLLHDLSDEPNAPQIACALAGHHLSTTADLVGLIRKSLPRVTKDEVDLTLRRVFQALRIAVNDELSALDSLLRCLPSVLNPNGRVAILTFHSGEDRRVKKAFATALRDGTYSEISHDVVRPSAAERRANPRSTPAKLRWARRAPASS
jgi:16S rRNA (cytosine1402-N4)-methyltransferase